jgi:hypothetical protein
MTPLELYWYILAVVLALLSGAVACAILWVAFNLAADAIHRKAGK